MLFEELAKVTCDWLWCNGRIGSMSKVRFGCSGRVAMKGANDRMKNIAGGVRGALQGVIDFSGCRLL
jgi:hypothetical protein